MKGGGGALADAFRGCMDSLFFLAIFVKPLHCKLISYGSTSSGDMSHVVACTVVAQTIFAVNNVSLPPAKLASVVQFHLDANGKQSSAAERGRKLHRNLTVIAPYADVLLQMVFRYTMQYGMGCWTTAVFQLPALTNLLLASRFFSLHGNTLKNTLGPLCSHQGGQGDVLEPFH